MISPGPQVVSCPQLSQMIVCILGSSVAGMAPETTTGFLVVVGFRHFLQMTFGWSSTTLHLLTAEAIRELREESKAFSGVRVYPWEHGRRFSCHLRGSH